MKPKTRKQNSLLWKISGNGIKKASYLFGTIHLICKNDFEIKPKVTKAFNKCKTLYMEMDLSGEVQHMNSIPKDSQKISEGLNEQERAELSQLLEKDYGISLQEVDHQPAIFLINKMLTGIIDCDETVVYEMEFLNMAITAGKPVFGLESLDEQMNIAANVYTPQELLNQLKARDNYKKMFDKMTKAYGREDLGTLLELITDPKLMSAETEQVMVGQRNLNWAAKLELILHEEPAFIAVGAGHLPGETGVIQLLKNKGYRLNPVYK